MRTLSPVRFEYARMGAVQVIAGLGLAAVAALTGHPGAVVIAVAITAVIFGGLTYLVDRRHLSEAIREAREAPTAHAETALMTWARVGRVAGTIVVILIAIAVLFGDPSIGAGILLGNGLMFLGLGGEVASWERRHGVRVYREPRWRWGIRGAGGRWGSRGAFDPADFYIDTPALGPPLG